MADLPDWFAAAVLKGYDGSALQTIKCATTGELYILLSALYNSTIKPLKCDTDGNAFLNVKAQDLAEVINRPKYGAAQLSTYLTLIGPKVTSTLITIEGKGVIYGGFCACYGSSVSHKGDFVQFLIDLRAISTGTFESMLNYGITQQPGCIATLLAYDETNFIYSVGFQFGITFESEIRLQYYNSVNEYLNIHSFFIYALV